MKSQGEEQMPKYPASYTAKFSKSTLDKVYKRGLGAYYSSGSRPNQTATSWGKARMYSYIMGGPTRRVDQHITDKYKVRLP